MKTAINPPTKASTPITIPTMPPPDMANPPLATPVAGRLEKLTADEELLLSVTANVGIPATGALVLDDIDAPDDDNEDDELVKHDVSEPAMTKKVSDKNT